jgi:hypothetical protein
MSPEKKEMSKPKARMRASVLMTQSLLRLKKQDSSTSESPDGTSPFKSPEIVITA